MTLAERVNASLLVPAPNILILDIERTAGAARFFDLRNDGYTSPKNVERWPALLCWAAKWYGQPKMIFEAEWRDHDRMIQKIWTLVDEADVIVGFNSARFDMAHLRTDWLLAGMPPPRPWTDVDLMKIVKSTFAFESNSLDSVTKRLGLAGKSGSYSMDEAQACLDGDKNAQRRMAKYNKADVALTEALYDHLRGWMPGHPLVGPSVDRGLICGQCASTELELQPTKYRTGAMEYDLYRCTNCGANIRASLGGVRVSGSRGVK